MMRTKEKERKALLLGGPVVVGFVWAIGAILFGVDWPLVSWDLWGGGPTLPGWLVLAAISIFCTLAVWFFKNLIVEFLKFLTAWEIPWGVRYQGRKMRPLRPLEFPWRDPRPKIQSLTSGVPIVSWVPHWTRTLYDRRVAKALGIALAVVVWAALLAWFWSPRFLWGILFSIVSFLFRLYSLEVERWNEVYTLADNRIVYRLARGWTNLYPELETVFDLSKAVEVDERIDLPTRIFGCARWVVLTSVGGGPVAKVEFLPWKTPLLRVFRFASSPKTGGTISLGYVLGLHWLSFLERVTKFQNRLGHLWRGAEISWSWGDPPVRKWGQWGQSGYVLNKDWPVQSRAHREEKDLVLKPHKAYYLSLGIWYAWETYQDARRMGFSSDEAWEAGRRRLQYYFVEVDGKKWEAALHAWQGKGLSPLSADWAGLYLPALEAVVSRWGSFTTPGPGVETVLEE